MPDPVRRTLHYTELPDMPTDNPLYHEWNLYRRELPRLLAEGHEGKWVLIKGDVILGLYSSDDEATRAGYDKLGLVSAMFVQQIRTEEPLVRVSPYCWPCHTSPSQ